MGEVAAAQRAAQHGNAKDRIETKRGFCAYSNCPGVAGGLPATPRAWMVCGMQRRKGSILPLCLLLCVPWLHLPPPHTPFPAPYPCGCEPRPWGALILGAAACIKP